MGFWLNNFAEFERKLNRENRLILNFSYVENGNDLEADQKNKSVKVYVPHKVKIPTWFLPPERAAEIVNNLRDDKDFSGLALERRVRGRFEVLEIDSKNNHRLLEKLGRIGFQTGDYTKLLRFGGFFPERKSILGERILSEANEDGEIEINDLSKISFGDFLTLDEAKKLPYVILDIEKPLWKKDREKELIKLRKKLLSANQDEKTWQRNKIIGKIESRLLCNDPEIERSGLYEERFDAKVSYVGSIWRNGNKQIKEVYVIDQNGEVEEEEHNGFKILKFKDEEALVGALTSSFKKRKPLVAIGHNEVYDYTQIRFAAEDSDVIFDPAVNDVQPRRDFVRDFLQRQKEDLIYIDTLWFGRIKHPYLNQKRFGTSFKLASLANHVGINFEKSLTHEQLREVEMRRIAGKTEETRKKAARQMVDYTCGDLGGTEELFNRLNPWTVLIEMKKALPFCTYTELAFSPNVMDKLHEYRHFADSGNLPYTGFKRGKRQEEIDFFKKKFPSMKNKRLKKVGLRKSPKGIYNNVSEYYVSLESWFLGYAFSLNPELREAYDNLKGNNEFAFLQYMKSYMVQIFNDYFQVHTQDDTKLKDAAERRFYAHYGFDTEEIRQRVRHGYRDLAESIRRNGMFYLDHIGDYIFVQGDGEIEGARKIRSLETFAVE